MTRLKHLFSPIKIGTMELKNRIVMPPMGSGFAENNSLSDAQIGHYSTRAKGGAGLIVVEGTAVHHSGRHPFVPAIDDDSLIPRWRELANAIHVHGAKVWCQLWHSGRQQFGISLIAASPIPAPIVKTMPKEMTREDIEEIVEAFGEGARRAREAGLDGVELHGAHGYLICNFLSPWSNKRTDEYGGSLMNRLRFALEIISRVRAKCGNDFPMGIRLSYDEMVTGGLLPEEMEVVCAIVAEAGA